MEIEQESGRVWYYAQYVQRDGDKKKSINATIKTLFPSLIH